MEYSLLIIVAVVNFIIHIIGAISGGKGLILRPILIFLGFPVQVVISSAITSGAITRFVKIYSFNKYKKIDWALAKVYFVIVAAAGIVGAMITVSVDESILKLIIGISILVVGTLLFFNKQLGLKEKKLTLSTWKKAMVYPFYFLTSILMIIVGGLGGILSYILIKFHGKTYITASATKSVIHLSTIFAVIYFILYSTINWALVITLAISGAIGTYFGVHYGIKAGNKWIRVLTLLVILVSGIKLIFFP